MLGCDPGLSSQEMHRCKDRGFCCGAGGARMWMEEKIGKRINVERTEEALGLDPDLISTACPFCMVMLSDAVTAKKADGEAKEHVAGARRRPDPAAVDGSSGQGHRTGASAGALAASPASLPADQVNRRAQSSDQISPYRLVCCAYFARCQAATASLVGPSNLPSAQPGVLGA